MTTTPGEADDSNDSSYTDVQIHDDQLPEDLRPDNDLAPSGAARPAEDAAGSDASDQLGQVSDANQTASHGDAAATDAAAPGS